MLNVGNNDYGVQNDALLRNKKVRRDVI